MKHAPGGVLALDLSSVVGWAYGHFQAEHPLVGTWILQKIGGFGARFSSFENALIDALEIHAPSKIVMEATIPLAAMNNAAAAKQQIGLWAYVQGEAYRYSIPVYEQDVGTVRQEVIGTCRFPKGEAKDHVMAWCRDNGAVVPDHNAGDARVLWEFYRRRFNTARAA